MYPKSTRCIACVHYSAPIIICTFIFFVVKLNAPMVHGRSNLPYHDHLKPIATFPCSNKTLPTCPSCRRRKDKLPRSQRPATDVLTEPYRCRSGQLPTAKPQINNIPHHLYCREDTWQRPCGRFMYLSRQTYIKTKTQGQVKEGRQLRRRPSRSPGKLCPYRC